MWAPLAVVHGFDKLPHLTSKDHKNVPSDGSEQHDLHTRLYKMITAKLPDPLTLVRNFGLMSEQDYLRLPLDQKRKFEMNMIEPKLDQLCRCFLYLNNAKIDYKLNLYWGNLDFSKQIPISKLTWPQNISHHKLDLVRGNIITNPELKSASKIKL
ncbi:hypothetical protein AYI70_g882 [Smittium culicis]|uniref:Uncharacterized protein n=1 Tax=Smittium culicis TaxID=133412 RepID=A0A1R1YFJ1_9FUNG|nr:hypothetical protein AYI70_g882 [Smittium culicis]